MKTAISLPDELHAAADRLAQRLGVSRSQLYARALAELVARYRGEEIRASYDRAYAEADPALDAAARAAARATFRREAW